LTEKEEIKREEQVMMSMLMKVAMCRLRINIGLPQGP
jgi:hypothetical protein